MKIKIAVAALGAVLVSAQVYAAPDHVYDYTYNGTTTTTNQSAAGAQLLNTEIVALTLHALGNDYWTASVSTFPWLPLEMQTGGTRIGDLTWTFLLDGSPVESGSYTNQSSSAVYIANPMPLSANIIFDEVHWEFTQISTDASPNTLGDIFSPVLAFVPSTGQGPVYVVVPDAAAPAPGSLALLGLALAGFGLLRRKRPS